MFDSKDMSVSAIHRRCVLVAEKGWAGALAAEEKTAAAAGEDKFPSEESILVQQAEAALRLATKLATPSK